jgi:hypothetical protein
VTELRDAQQETVLPQHQTPCPESSSGPEEKGGGQPASASRCRRAMNEGCSGMESAWGLRILNEFPLNFRQLQHKNCTKVGILYFVASAQACPFSSRTSSQVSLYWFFTTGEGSLRTQEIGAQDWAVLSCNLLGTLQSVF